MILFIDALTVGKRLAAVDVTTDMALRGEYPNFGYFGIRPEGWTPPEGLPWPARHMVRCGIRANMVTALLSDIGATATTIVIHGRDRVMGAIHHEREIDKRPVAWVRPNVDIRCTSRSAASIVKVPNPKATGDDQWLLPTLDQCRAHFAISERGVDAVAALHERLVAAGALEAA